MPQFSSTNQPLTQGRKKGGKLAKYLRKNPKLTGEEVRTLFTTILFAYSEKELYKMVKDIKAPMIVRVVIRAFLNDFKSGNLKSVEILLNRAFGRPEQKIELDVELNAADMSQEEKQNIITGYFEKMKKPE